MIKHKQRLVLFGAGGHAKVAMDASEKQGDYNIIGLFDDDDALLGQITFDYKVLGGRQELLNQKSDFDVALIAIGNNQIRRQLAQVITKHPIKLATIIHPSAQISRGVTIKGGTVVFASTTINADSEIGKHVIINTGAKVDHDCVIGDFVHLAPGVNICGSVTIGAGSFIGAGATVIPGITIGENVIVGAGSTVIRDLPSGVKVAGCPAIKLKEKNASE